MRLYILRHGEAEARAASDAERALTGHGRNEIGSVAEQLKRKVPEIARVLVSPYRRAQETAAIMVETLGLPTPETERLLTPDSSPWLVLELLRQVPTQDGVLLVSHMPLVGRLVLELAPGLGAKGFQTGELVVLDWPGEGAGELVSRLFPA